MNISEKKNGGAYVVTDYAGGGTATAAGTGDATDQAGPWLDRTRAGKSVPMGSVKIVVGYSTTLAANKALKLAFQLKDADDGSGTNAANFGAAYASTAVVTDGGSGGTYTGTAEFDVDLTMARNWVQANVTPDLTATGTDTCDLRSIAIWFGSDRLPVGASLI